MYTLVSTVCTIEHFQVLPVYADEKSTGRPVSLKVRSFPNTYNDENLENKVMRS